jgi:thiol:disulfide interchange protein DsbC
MKIIARLTACLLALGLGFAVHAQTPDSIKAELKKRFPDAPIDSVRKTAYGNIYEVVGGGEMFYTDDKASFLIVGGNLIDTKTRENVTEARQRQLTAVKFDALPLDQAFKIVRGNGSRKIAMFADPNCGYCKRFERDLLTVNDITVYMFLYPILSPDSTEKSKSVWCSADRGKAWIDLMTRDTPPVAAPSCDTPIDKILAFGREKRIQGTPTIFFEDGERIPGAMAKEQLEKRLADAKVAVAKQAAAK